MLSPLGEFADKNSKQRWRNLFLRELGRLAPYVAESLRDSVFIPYRSVFPVYASVLDELEAHGLRLEIAAWAKAHPNHGLSERELYAYYNAFLYDETNQNFWTNYCLADNECHPELIPAREAVLRWSLHWNMDGDWWRSVALFTLNEWDDELDLELWGGSYSYVDAISKDEELKLRPFPGMLRWEPARMTRKMYLEKLESSIRQEIDKDLLLSASTAKVRTDLLDSLMLKVSEYCDEIERIYESHQSWKKVIPKRNLENHVAWTIKFQIDRKTFSEIAEESEVSKQAVIKAVREFLNLIDLKERPGVERGRPRSAKDSPTSRRQRVKGL